MKKPSWSIRLLYAMLTDPKFSFEYFNRDQRLSAKKGGVRWSIMKPQLDYMMGLLLSNEIVVASGRSVGKCVKYGSKVELESGKRVKAESLINTLFKIKSYDELDHKFKWVRGFAHDNGKRICYKLTLENRLSTCVTVEHPFLTETGWKRVIELTDHILTIENGTLTRVKIKNIKYIGRHPTVAISVPETRNHIIDGILSHNTSSVEHMLFMISLTNPKKWSAYIVKNAKHANVLIQHLIDYFNKDSFSREFYGSYDKKDRIFSMKNGHKIEIRIAGHDKTGASTMVSGHYDYIFVDEAQILPKRILDELIPALKEGGKMIVTGVPNDVRDSILYYYVSRKNVMYYRYASYESTDWDEDKEKRAIELYGGKHTPQWKNLVEGCLPPGQLIFTKRGLIPIENVGIGDEVITHTGNWCKVLSKFEFDHDGDLYTLNTDCDDNILKVTENHPIMVTSNNLNYSLLTPDKINTDYKILFPRIQNNENFIMINDFKITNDFMYELGTYLKNGNASRYSEIILKCVKDNFILFDIYNVPRIHLTWFISSLYKDGVYTTTSASSAYQVKVILRSMGINPHLIINGDNYTVDINNKDKFDIGSKITKIDKEYYKGKVYDLMVDIDHTMTVYDYITSNSWGDHASSVFRPSKLVDGLIKNDSFRYKSFNGNSFEDLFPQLNLPPLRPKYNFYIIGGDMGYTSNSPSHIITLGVYNKKDNDGNDIQHYDVLYRLEIENMASFNMAKTMNYLVEYFNCKHVAIDSQTFGHQVYDHMIDKEIFPTTFRQNKMYMYPVIFTRPLIKGTIDTIDQTTGQLIKEEIKYAEKVAGTLKIAELVDEERLHIAHEDSGAEDFDDLVTIMMAETQTASTRRLHPMIYSNSVNEHCVDALRCCGIIILQIIEKGLSRYGFQTTSARPVRLDKGLFKPNDKFKRRARYNG